MILHTFGVQEMLFLFCCSDIMLGMDPVRGPWPKYLGSIEGTQGVGGGLGFNHRFRV